MRALLMLMAMATTVTPALAQEHRQDAGGAIIVTGSALAETSKKLKDCVARHCSPKDDISATLVHAESQYLAGDYDGAWTTLSRSNNRNARYSAEYPQEVANLQRAYGRLTDIIGLPENGRVLQIFAFDTLRDSFGANDARTLNQQLATGDYSLGTGRLTRAMDVYRRVERKAQAAGQLEVQGRAMLRQAGIYSTLATRDRGYASLARANIDRIAQTTAPELATYRTAAEILRARLTASRGGAASIDKAVAGLSGKSVSVPIEVYSPPLLGLDPGVGTLAPANPEWIDVRYRIEPSGRVEDIEQLNSSEKITGDWAKQVRASLAKRRYAPVDPGADGEGLVRTERFSLVFDITRETQSRVLGRNGNPRIVTLDLADKPEQGAL